ncbi:hypothetical protein NE237_017834 [Protea cynaroides]|uniref:Uncharacterized protein n=1 Tax=Protea cynaroides TaxID=273540 RepID=A0A9Q0QNE7_9MAGN|nr:hypothetical protein NE237_017834 [Protea cynaroides]
MREGPTYHGDVDGEFGVTEDGEEHGDAGGEGEDDGRAGLFSGSEAGILKRILPVSFAPARWFDVNRSPSAEEAEDGALNVGNSNFFGHGFNTKLSSVGLVYKMDFSMFRGGSSSSSKIDNTEATAADAMNDVDTTERDSSRASDEENGLAWKKLRLSKEQSAFLEESFKEHNILNPKQKLALAKQWSNRYI